LTYSIKHHTSGVFDYSDSAHQRRLVILVDVHAVVFLENWGTLSSVSNPVEINNNLLKLHSWIG